MLDLYRTAMFMFRKSNQCMEDYVTALLASIYYVSNGTTSTSHFLNTGSRSTSVTLECDVFASRTGSLINEIRSCRVEIVRNRTGATLVAFSG